MYSTFSGVALGQAINHEPSAACERAIDLEQVPSVDEVLKPTAAVSALFTIDKIARYR